MNRANIEAFIALTKEKNIVKAADTLYLSPSTVSSQLKSLEEELGIRLFERHKGQKTITLTPKGEAFSKIAYDFLALSNECMQLRNKTEQNHISIATADSFLEYNLAPFYKQLILGKEKFNLEIKLHTSDMIYSMISKKEVDIGFSTYHIKYPDVITELVFVDDIVVLVPQNSTIKDSIISPSRLEPQKEFQVGSPKNKYIGCGTDFNTWRTKWLDAEKEPLVRVNSISVLYNFLMVKGVDFWLFAPMTTAQGLKEEYDLRIVELEENPPKRKCYLLTHMYPTETTKRNIGIFKKALSEYINNYYN